MLTDQEIKDRANIYRQLIDFKPFQYLVAEAEEDIKEIKDISINTLLDGLHDKAAMEASLIPGIRRVIDKPYDAVKESNNLNENS